MFTLKYFKGIEEAQRAPPGPPVPFDIEELSPKPGLGAALGSLFIAVIPFALGVLRAIWPNPQIGRLIVVTRDADVRQVLMDMDTFETPFGPEMTELAGGTNSVLGLGGAPHARINGILRQVLKSEDIAGIAKRSSEVAKALIDGSGGRIDVMGDLVTRVATEMSASYLGLEIDDPGAFADWTMAISALLFADPTGNPVTRRLALFGAAQLRRVIGRAIADAHRHPDSDTVIGRLVALQASDPTLTDGEILANIMGLTTGFIPTNTLQAGRMLQALLARPQIMKTAGDMARRQDRDGLRAILIEAARLNPALFPGQWRYATKAGVIAPGTWRAKKVRPDTVLLVSTASALRDSCAFPHPGRFQVGRTPSPDLMFGDGPHYCLGKAIALAQITETFLVLFAQGRLRPVPGPDGKLTTVGPFPRRLDMAFEPASGPVPQTMITMCAQVRTTIPQAALEQEVAALGNPAAPGIAAALKATGVVHFASLSVAQATIGETNACYLLFELSVDGPQDRAIDLVAAHVARWLTPIFAHANPDNLELAQLLRRSALDLGARPWGATGLEFFGTPGLTVADIDRQTDLAAFARDGLDHYLKGHIGLDGRSMQALGYVRRLIRQDASLTAEVAALRSEGRTPEADALTSLLARGASLADFLIRPSRRRLAFADWTDPGPWTLWGQLSDAANTSAGRLILGLFGAAWLVLAVAIFVAFGALGWLGLPGRILVALACGVVSAGALFGWAAFAFLKTLEAKEAADVPDDREPDLAHVEAVTLRENHPGYAQNHIIAVTPMKPGGFRKLTLAIALWGIALMVKTQFRPGFVVTMGTIHFARWFRIPKSETLIFFSNYDGSWQSYLEDFIMRAHQGQTAVWSNGIGFPRTHDLINGGAQDGDRFKRWVRRQQQPSLFWYSRFPRLTTEEMRNNALIHDGLMRAINDTAARAWLGCFGSLQRSEDSIEADEVQSLVFNGLRPLSYAALGLARAPESSQRRKAWLREIVREPTETGDSRASLLLTFGDHPTDEEHHPSATFVAFSAGGLAKLGVPGAEGDEGLATFANVFNIGMAARSRVLGDAGKSAPQEWYWSDAAADIAILVYGTSAQGCEAALAAHAELLGGPFLHVVHTSPVGQDIDFEHFGFRDGISQPILRGTQRFAVNSLTRDIVEPGEFILGYQNNQGYFAPSPIVAADSDGRDNLPTAASDAPPAFPDFVTEDSSYAARDLGRNGSFLVIRQLAQDVEGFRSFTEEKAREVARSYGNVRDVTGGPVSAEWVAAKLMGRWRDGTPLIDRPTAEAPGTARSATPDNDFAYGEDDPGGLLCPLGAHIRRANPRDSLQPGDPTEQAITNRHRLLRRGRTYEAAGEKGLLFMCFCADLERQFEFVQQTWVGSPAFHGLTDEPDPVVSQTDADGRRVFTIPTTSGPVTLQNMQSFVTVKGGGYFFLPSRSALRYLHDLG